jgi:hypothetical protein
MAKSNKGLFKFNLLPKKTKEELEIYEERDVSIIYSFLLVFGAVFVFLVLNIVQLIFIQTNLNRLDSDIANADSQIADFFSIKRVNGELISKSRLLQEPLSEDIKINTFLSYADGLIGQYGSISNYDREPSGTFVLTATFSSVVSIQNALIAANESEDVENVFLRTIVTNDQGNYIGRIAFDVVQDDLLIQ